MPSGSLPSTYVKITGTIGPDTYEQQFPLTDPQFGLGGIRTVGTTTEMEAIYIDRRQEGMIVYVSGITAYYALIGTTANSGWTTGFTFGRSVNNITNYVASFNGQTGAVQGVSSWNGQTGAVTFNNYVSSFNGLTGAVQGVSAAVAGTGIFVSAATGSVTITNTGVQSFNGLTGAVQGVSSWNGQTGAVQFHNYVSAFNGVTGAVQGVSSFQGRTGAIGFVSGQGITLSVSGATTTVDLNYLYGGTSLSAQKYPDKPDWVVFQSSSAPFSMYRTQLQNISYVLLGSLGTKGSGNFFRMASSIDGGAGTATDEYVSFSNIANELIGIIDGGTFA
jgi:hypothetical protein